MGGEKEKITFEECREYAIEHGFNSVRFYVCGNGKKLKAKWLDAYCSFFEIDGLKGFVAISQIKSMGNYLCKIIE